MASGKVVVPKKQLSPTKPSTAKEVFARIIGDEMKELTLKLREMIAEMRAKCVSKEKIKKAAHEIKKWLPAVTWSVAVFDPQEKHRDNVKEHSGLLGVDIDDVQDIPDAIAKLKMSPHVMAVWRSVSGSGVRAVLRVEPSTEKHLASWDAAQKHVRKFAGLEIDTKCKDVARLCFISWDPDLFVKEAEVLPPAEIEEKKRPELDPGKLSEYQQIAGEIIGADINWISNVEGLLHCPFEEEHHEKNGERDLRVRLDGVPTFSCFHVSCSAHYVELNRRLRRAILGSGDVRSFKELCKNIETCNTFDDLVRNVAGNIQNHRHLDAAQRDMLEKAAHEKFRRSGVRIKTVRNLLAIRKTEAEKEKEQQEFLEQTAWVEDYVWIIPEKAYRHKLTARYFPPDALNHLHTKDVPDAIMAHTFVTKQGRTPTVDALGYLPEISEKVVRMPDGKLYYNIYNPNSEIKSKKPTTHQRRLIRSFLRHLQLIVFGEPVETRRTHFRNLLFTLAHIIQNPGEMLPFALLIKSFQGGGKSVLADIVSQIIGEDNIARPTPDMVMQEKNNGFLWGKRVVFFEELKLHGHAGQAIYNKLKTYVTNSMINFEDKWVKNFKTYNRMVCIGLTNYFEALPTTDDDRRWYVFELPGRNRAALAKVLCYIAGGIHPQWGEKVLTDHFADLWALAKPENGAALKWWLSGVKIPQRFENIHESPMTIYKEKMTAAQIDQADGAFYLREALAQGGKFITEEVASSAYVWRKVEKMRREECCEYEDGQLVTVHEFPKPYNDQQKRHAWTKLGYKPLGNGFLKVEGQSHRVYVRDTSVDNDKARRMLLETVRGEQFNKI